MNNMVAYNKMSAATTTKKFQKKKKQKIPEANRLATINNHPIENSRDLNSDSLQSLSFITYHFSSKNSVIN